MRWGIILLVASAATSGATEPDRRALAEKAAQVLRKNCHRCHGEDGSVEGGFNFVLDVPRLIASRKIVPGKPDESPLWKRLAKDSMPPAGEEPRPDETERAIVRQWIEAGAPASADSPPRPRVTSADVLRWVLDDLQTFDRRSRRFLRYFSLVPQYQQGASADELQTYRYAVSKLVNSLSWSPRIRVPAAVGPHQLLLRIDLRWYMWDANLWNRLLAEYPYGILDDGAASRAVMAATATKMPIVRADWFVATACRPPLYFDLLQLPASLPELERQLRVDSFANIQQERVARAGFNGSGISKNNRVIERHESVHGAYWKTYDFEAIPQNLVERGLLAPDPRNIFAFPLGPAGASPREPFLTVGGEVIFSLPNGLHGYMLYNAAGNRIDKGPLQIVSDPKRPDRAVETGISCMSCHLTGINPKSDQIRDFLAKNPQVFPRSEAELIRSLYVPVDTMSRLMREDIDRYRHAVEQTGARIGKSEPVSAVTMRYEADLDLTTAAAEAGLPPDTLREAIERSESLSRSLGGLRIDGGSVSRPLWVQTFADLVRDLRLGTLLRSVAAAGSLPDNTGELDPLEGPGQQTNAAAISPDGLRLVLASADRTARLWDARADREIRRLVGHAASVWSVALSPDGKRVATGSVDGSVRVWDVESGQEVRRLEGHLSLVSGVVWMPDGSKLVSAGHDGHIVLWDLATGSETRRWTNLGQTVHAIVPHPRGRRVFAAVDHRVVSIDVESGESVERLIIEGDVPSCLAVSPDGATIAIGTDSGRVVVREVEKDDPPTEIAATQPPSPVLAIDFAPSGKVLAVASAVGLVRLLERATGQELGRFTRHSEAVVAVAFVNSGRETVSVGRDSSVRRWNLAKFYDLVRPAAQGVEPAATRENTSMPQLEPSAIISIRGMIDCMRLSPDGRWLYFIDHAQGRLVQLDTAQARQAKAWSLPPSTEAFVLSPNGRSIWLIGLSQGKPTLWRLDAASLEVQKRSELDSLPYDLAATDEGVVFLSGRDAGWSDIVVFDASRSVVLGRWSGIWSRSLLQLAPNQSRLYVATQGVSPGKIEGFPLPTDFTLKPQPSTTPSDEGVAPAGPSVISPDGKLLVARNGSVFRLSGDPGDDLKFVGRVPRHLDVAIFPDRSELWLLASDGQTLKRYSYPELNWQFDYRLPQPAYRMTGDPGRGRLYLAVVDPKNAASPRVRGLADIHVYEPTR